MKSTLRGGGPQRGGTVRAVDYSSLVYTNNNDKAISFKIILYGFERSYITVYLPGRDYISLRWACELNYGESFKDVFSPEGDLPIIDIA